MISWAIKAVRSRVSTGFFILHLAIVFIFAFFAALLFEPLWLKNVALAHSILELICIFVALSAFVIVWFTYVAGPKYNQVVGFGFLAVACFDTYHLIFWAGFNLFPAGYFGLSAWHWVMGRLTEAVTILLIAFYSPIKRINKWIGLVISVVWAAGISRLFLSHPQWFPTLMTEDGITPLKAVIEYLIIALFAVSMFKIVKDKKKNDFVSYKHILMSLMIAIPGELCFTLFTTITSFYNTLGHILKVAYYIFLFRAIFISAIEYPYKKLKESKNKLEMLNSRLEETNKQYYDLLNRMPIAMLSFRSDSRLKFANSEALKLLGCKLDDVEELTIKEMAASFYESKKQALRNKRSPQLKCGKLKNHIRTIHNKRGEKLSLRLDVHKLENNDYAVLINDAKLEQELENLQFQTQTILNSLTNTIAVMDRQNRIIMINKVFEEVYEVKASDVLGMDRGELNRLLQCSNMDVPHNVESNEKKAYEVSITTLNSNKKDLLLMPAPIFNIEGEQIGLISVGTDITKLNMEHKKLQQQEKLALIGQMGAGIVHETKNHLASIKGYCQLISTKISDNHIKYYVDRIESISADVNRVIADFLSIAKPSETVMDVVSVNEIIESMKYMLESPSFMKGVAIEIRLGCFDRDILADEAQIKQVILNMAKNAIEAVAEASDPKLLISTELGASGNEVLVVIADNGKGIKAEDIDKLGNPFFTTKETGTGLGLSVCYRIIKAHGGNINVRSKLGEGTVFTISMPCYKEGQ